jgi:hypothetical protein
MEFVCLFCFVDIHLFGEVGIAQSKDCELDGQLGSQVRTRDFSLPQSVQTYCKAQSSSYTVGTVRFSSVQPGARRPVREISHTSSSTIKMNSGAVPPLP